MSKALMETLANVVIATAVMLFMCMAAYGLRRLQDIANEWLGQKKEEAQQKGDDLLLRMFGTMQDLVNTIVYHAVAAMEQTKASDLREQVKKGLADRNELLSLADDVLAQVKEQLDPDVERILSMYISDMDTYLKNQIEASLRMVKNAQPQGGILLSEIGQACQEEYSGEPEEGFDDTEIIL